MKDKEYKVIITRPDGTKYTELYDTLREAFDAAWQINLSHNWHAELQGKYCGEYKKLY